MADPVLHLIAGPNGAGKSTLHQFVIEPVTHLEFVNADVIAAAEWPDAPEAHSYEAAALAAERRGALIEAGTSFVTETVFSHESKLDLVQAARARGYLITLHIVMVPVELAVARVASRVAVGGHTVPEDKVRSRYERLWPLVAEAIGIADTAAVYDNSRVADALRLVATYERGVLIEDPDWPSWTPGPLRTAGQG